MSETKRTRRSPQQVWEDKVKAQESKVNRIQADLDKAKKELEDLKNTPPKFIIRANESTLISKISKYPKHLKELAEIISVDDEQTRRTKLKELLIKIESEAE